MFRPHVVICAACSSTPKAGLCNLRCFHSQLADMTVRNLGVLEALWLHPRQTSLLLKTDQRRQWCLASTCARKRESKLAARTLGQEFGRVLTSFQLVKNDLFHSERGDANFPHILS
jgi:hypothetical protein